LIPHFLRAIPILILGIHLAAAQTLPEGMTMHRKNAGDLDASGWTTAASTMGRFSVRLPLKFNDFTMQMPPTDVNVAAIFGVGGKTTEGIKFVAQRIVYRRDDGAPQFFSRIAKGEGFQAKVTVLGIVENRDRRSVDLMLENDQTVARLRYVLTDRSIVYMVVEIPRAHSTLVSDGMVQRFFESLDVTPL